jgi:hypothetical protein
LREQLRPAAPAETKRLQKLAAALDSDKFQVRQRAFEELKSRGFEAEPVLLEALAKKPSPEVRRRIDLLLTLPRQIDSPDWLRRLRGIHLLEQIATPDARHHLETLAAGVPNARLSQEAGRARDRLRRRVEQPER